jgi:hypothetical protein
MTLVGGMVLYPLGVTIDFWDHYPSKELDWVLASFGFAKCYIDDIIVFNLTPKDHMHHLQEMLKRFKEHNLKLHLSKCQFFQT